MFLILDHKDSAFSKSLQATAKKMNLNTLYLTENQIVHDIEIDYRLTDQDNRFTIHFGDQLVKSEDLYAAYCGLDYFKPALWPYFTDEDANYAAQETYALWLALLTSLSCRMLNSPSLDALAGHILSVPETLSVARNYGLNIPLSITLESGNSALALLVAQGTLQFTNLGQIYPQELVINLLDTKKCTNTDNHCRITEILAGRVVYIAVVGERFFVSGKKARLPSFPLDIMIPKYIRTGLQGMQNQLELDMAEYQFRIRSERKWIFSGYSRIPSNAMTAYGDTLMKHVVNYALGYAGS